MLCACIRENEEEVGPGHQNRKGEGGRQEAGGVQHGDPITRDVVESTVGPNE